MLANDACPVTWKTESVRTFCFKMQLQSNPKCVFEKKKKRVQYTYTRKRSIILIIPYSIRADYTINPAY